MRPTWLGDRTVQSVITLRVIADLDTEPRTTEVRRSNAMPVSSNPPQRICMRIPDVAAATGLSERKIWTLVRSGELASHKPGRAILITPEAVRDWLAANPNNPNGGATAKQ